MVQRCWVKLPVPGCPTIWIIAGHGPTAEGCLDIFSLSVILSSSSLSLEGSPI